MRRSVLLWAAVGLVAVMLAAGGLLLGRPPEASVVLSPLPELPREATAVLLHGDKGLFPGEMAEALLRVRVALGEAPDSVIPSLALVASVDEAALLVPLEGARTGPLGAARLSSEEAEDVRSKRIPEALKFPEASLSDEGEGVLRLTAPSLSAPLFLFLREDLLLLARAPEDLSAMRGALEGRTPRLLPEGFREERRWGEHLRVYLGTGPFFGRFLRSPRGETAPLTVEAAIRHAPKGGEAKIRLSGLRERLGAQLLGKWRPVSFSPSVVVPRPLMALMGVNLPEDADFLKMLLPEGSSALEAIGGGELREALPGQAYLSLGGRTRVLWFSLPGLLLDLPDRGRSGKRLVEAVWSRLFLGASPDRVEGFDVGGATDLPVSAVAAANDDRALLGPVDPGALGPLDKDEEGFIPSGKCLLFFAADFGRLAAAMGELKQLDDFLEEAPGSAADEGLEAARRAVSGLGRAILVLDSAEIGHMTWER